MPAPVLPTRYRDVVYVAEGAFGQVYRALAEDGRAVAVKVLAAELAGRSDVVWEFTAEYRRLSALSHSAFPEAIEQGLTAEGRPFIAMTFLSGTSAAADTPLPAGKARRVLADIAAALQHLHGTGLVHGDLKADNVLVTPDATYLLDLGGAAPIGQVRAEVGGTLEYMAPEVLRRAEVAPEADWYALGVLGYLLLSGSLPFRVGPAGPAGLVRAQLFEAPAPLPDSVIAAAPELAAAILALLAKEPERRAAAIGQVLGVLGIAPLTGNARGLLSGAWVSRPDVASAWAKLFAAPDHRTLAIRGTQGAGKSWLLAALRLEARLAGRAWIAVSCGGAVESPGSAARVVLRQVLAEAGLPPSPQVAAWLNGQAPAEWLDLEPRARKLSLFRALGEAWASATSALGDLVIALDDGLVADAASQEIFAHLQTTALGLRARWCVTCGPDDALPPDAAEFSLADWTAEELAQLVAARLGGAAPAALMEALALVGASRPGQVNTLLDHWHMSGELQRGGGSWRFVAEASASTKADPWEQLWNDKVARLTADAQAALQLSAASFAAGPLPPQSLAEALAISDTHMQSALDMLLAQGLVVRTADGVRLVAGGVAERLSAMLPAIERRELLVRLARSVLGRGPTTLGVPSDVELAAWPLPTLVAASELASRGDDDELAIVLAAAAARRSLDMLALDDALRLIAQSRDRLDENVPQALHLAMVLVSAEAGRIADRGAEALADFETALALAVASGAEYATAQAALGLAKCHQLRGRYAKALDLATQSEEAAERAAAPALAARAAVAKARIELFMGLGNAKARASCARASKLASQGNSRAMRSAALNLQGVLLIQDDPGARNEALAMIREAISLAEEVGDLVGVAAALENLGNAFLALGELREARDAFARGADMCQAHGIGTEGLSADMNLALVLAELGEVDRALVLAADVAERAERLDRTFIRSIALAAYGQAAWRSGQVLEASEKLDLALELTQRIKNKVAEELVRLARLESFLAMGDTAAAQVESLAAEELVELTDQAESRARLACLQASLALVNGDFEGASALASPYIDGANRALAYAAHGVLARVELAAGRPMGARDHYEQVAAVARHWQAPWHLAAARLGLAVAAQHAHAVEIGAAASDAEEAVAQAREAMAPGPNVFARAGGAAMLAIAGQTDEASVTILEELSVLLAPLEEAARERLLAAQGLPTALQLDALRPPKSTAPIGGGDLLLEFAGWHSAVLAAEDELDVDQVVLAGLMALATADRGYVLAYDKGRLNEVVTYGVDYAREVAQGFSGSIVEEVLLSGETVYMIDAATDDRWREAASVQALGLRTVIALPFGTPQQMLGVIYMDRLAIEPTLGPVELQVLGLLAGTAAARIVAMRREAELVSELAFERIVTSTALALTRTPTTRARRDVVLDAALALTRGERGLWLGRAEDSADWLALASRDAAGASPAFEHGSLSQTVLARAASAQEPLCLVDAEPPDTWTPGQSLLTLGIRMVWCLPMTPDASELMYVDTTRLENRDHRAALERVVALLDRLGLSGG